MRNKFETWLSRNAPAGQAWKDRLLSLVAAGTATALVGLSVILMAGVGLPGEGIQARAPAVTPQPAQTVRHAEPLPTVTIIGRRQPGDSPALAIQTTSAELPARAASAEAAAGIAIAGDNLRQ